VEQLERLGRSVAGRTNRHATFNRQVRQKLPNFPFAHLIRMPLLVKQDEPPTPTDIRFFRRQGIVPTPEDIAKLIKELRFCRKNRTHIRLPLTALVPDITRDDSIVFS
jgi:hypothetical protein